MLANKVLKGASLTFLHIDINSGVLFVDFVFVVSQEVGVVETGQSIYFVYDVLLLFVRRPLKGNPS